MARTNTAGKTRGGATFGGRAVSKAARPHAKKTSPAKVRLRCLCRRLHVSPLTFVLLSRVVTEGITSQGTVAQEGAARNEEAAHHGSKEGSHCQSPAPACSADSLLLASVACTQAALERKKAKEAQAKKNKALLQKFLAGEVNELFLRDREAFVEDGEYDCATRIAKCLDTTRLFNIAWHKYDEETGKWVPDGRASGITVNETIDRPTLERGKYEVVDAGKMPHRDALTSLAQPKGFGL
jgi:hypothetical protein